MKFSANGYYIESYLKCDNCGVLIYAELDNATPGPNSTSFCSPWCKQWHAERMAGVESPRIDLAFDPIT